MEELVGKLLRSARCVNSIPWEGNYGEGIANSLRVGDIVLITEVEEYDCYCRNKNNGLFACVDVAWTPRIQLRFITPREEMAGLDIPLALLHLAFPGVKEVAPDLERRSVKLYEMELIKKNPSGALNPNPTDFFMDNSDWGDRVW